MRRFLGLCCGLLWALCWSGPAAARDVELAERLFREGRDLLEQKRFAEACPKLAESLQEDEATGTLLALALCHEGAGRFASAWSYYQRASTRALELNEAERARIATQRATVLMPRLSRLRIAVPKELADLPDLVIRRNGVAVDRLDYDVAVPVDGGVQVIEASAGPRGPFEVRLLVAAERESAVVLVTLPRAEPPAAVALPPAPVPSAPPAAPVARHAAAEGAPTSALRPVAYVTGGVGLLVLGGSLAAGIHAKTRYDASNRNGHCDATGCDERGIELRNSAISSAHVATALFIAGGVLTTAGVGLYLYQDMRSGQSVRAGIRSAPSSGEVSVLFEGAL